MTKKDRISAFFFFGIALFICIESIRIGVGSFGNPGAGFIPMGCGLGIGTMSLVVFAFTLKNSPKKKEVRPDGEIKLLSIFLALASMVAYAFLIDSLGFQLVTFLWMSFVCRWIGRMSWKSTIFTSLVATFTCNFLFGYFLEIRFPKGILGL